MGSVSTTTVGGYPLAEVKGMVWPEVMTVFRETDRRETESTDSEFGRIGAVQYVASVAVVVDRLEVMGFTLSRLRQVYGERVEAKLAELREWETDDPTSWRDEIEILEHLTFDRWMGTLDQIKKQHIVLWNLGEGTPALVRRLVEDWDEESLYGFPDGDVRYLLRAFCNVSDPSDLVVEDVTDLVNGGYYGEDDRVCEMAMLKLTKERPISDRTIVLTEGRSDTRILKQALEVLYPHLLDYFSFLDFEEARAPGGAGHLTNILKSFIAAGISNRIIALYDNDTEARDARRSLDSVVLPPNVRVLGLPALDLGREYPTIGPTGPALMDVNGLACSIEMYLGESALRGDDGKFIPVQWRGYRESLGAYQGEVLRKVEIHRRFDERARQCAQDRSAVQEKDWAGLRSIIDLLRTAFQQRD